MTSTAETDSSPAAGFSLIDMLVALVLLSAIVGLMAAFIGQFRSISRIERTVSARSEIDALAAYLEQAIGNAMPMAFIASDPQSRRVFEGTASSLRFVTVARQGAKSFGLRETMIRLDGNGPKVLVQRFEPRRLDPGKRDEAAVEIVLADWIADARFEYLSYAPLTLAPVWKNEWIDQTLPAAVRFKIVAMRNSLGVETDGYTIIKLSSARTAATATP